MGTDERGVSGPVRVRVPARREGEGTLPRGKRDSENGGNLQIRENRYLPGQNPGPDIAAII
jgi:hypothetical protein